MNGVAAVTLTQAQAIITASSQICNICAHICCMWPCQCHCLTGVTAATLETASTSCTTGCPLDAVSPVCGGDGLTYMTFCLAICSGNTSITYTGPCLPGGSPEAVARATAPGATSAPADLADRHPVASLFGGDISSTSAPGASRRAVATPRDMRRYAKDGFVLVGTIARDTDGPTGSSTELGGKPSSNADAM